MASSAARRCRVGHWPLGHPAHRRWRAILLAVLGAGMLHAAPAATSLTPATGLSCPDTRSAGPRGTKDPKSSFVEPAAALSPQTLAGGDPPPCATSAAPNVFQPPLRRVLRERYSSRAPPKGGVPLYLTTLRLRI